MEALYNKYRPQIFEDVVGQEHIERTLKNAIASNKLSHAYIFTGPRGTGKTTTARLLAKALLCDEGPTPNPDGTCEECLLVAKGEHPDVYELDAASRTGVENVREEIIGRVDYAPTRGNYKVYIIDEVHMLTTAAFNALLKTLEEPPAHVVFIMCTTDPQKVPETILSRCQRFDFRRISPEELISRLGAICEMEGIEFEGDALDLIAHRAQGGMRDALTSLEQLIAFGGGIVSMDAAERVLGTLDCSDLADIVKAIGKRDAAECFNWTASYMETGADMVQFTADLAAHVRDMYVMSLAGTDVALDLNDAARREIEVELAWFGPDRLARMLEVLGDLMRELKTSTNQRLSFEIALTRMIRPDSDLTLSSLAERIEAIESGNAAVAPNRPIPAASPSPDLAAPSQRADDAKAPIDEPSEAPSEPVAQAPLSPSNAEQFWNTVLAHLKKIGPAFGVVFMSTNVSLDGDRLAIEFPANNDFSFKAAQKQDARDALDKALQRAGRPGLAYDITQASGSHAAEVAPESASAHMGSAQEAEPAREASHAQGFAPIPDNVAAQETGKGAAQEPTRAAAQETGNGAAQARGGADRANQGDGAGDGGNIGGDPDFQDFLTSAFGDEIVFEEVD